MAQPYERKTYLPLILLNNAYEVKERICMQLILKYMVIDYITARTLITKPLRRLNYFQHDSEGAVVAS
jgi:hypothetical protein